MYSPDWFIFKAEEENRCLHRAIPVELKTISDHSLSLKAEIHARNQLSVGAEYVMRNRRVRVDYGVLIVVNERTRTFTWEKIEYGHLTT